MYQHITAAYYEPMIIILLLSQSTTYEYFDARLIFLCPVAARTFF